MNSIDLTNEEAAVAYNIICTYIMNHAAFNQVTPEMTSLAAKLQNHLDEIEAADQAVEEVMAEIAEEAPAEEAPAEEAPAA